MPFDIEGALRGGIDRTFEDSGLTVAGAFFVLGALSTLAAAGAVGPGPRGPMIPGTMGPADPYGISLGIPVALAGVVSLVAWVATVVVAVAAIRLFVSDETDRVPQEFFTRNVAWAWINYVIGGIVFGIVIGIGFVLLIIPGIFLLVSLIFWTVFVAVEDENFVEAFRRSWRLTKGTGGWSSVSASRWRSSSSSLTRFSAESVR